MRVQDAENIHPNEIAQKVLKFGRTQMGTNGEEAVYHSPHREDKDPSVHINILTKKFYDNGIQFGSRGAINFACYLLNIDHNDPGACRQALRYLDALFAHSSTRKNTVLSSIQKRDKPATSLKKKGESHIQITKVKPLFSYSLKDYLSKTRCLNLEIVSHYVKEVHCRTQGGKEFFGVGSPAGQAYVIRNKGNLGKIIDGRPGEPFKGIAGKNLDITVYEKHTDEVLLFEGAPDFYSYLTRENLKHPKITSIVLNSVHMIDRLFNYLEKNQNIKKIYYFRDNDKAGEQSISNLKKQLIEKELYIIVEDQASQYQGFNDLNEWLCHQ